MTSQTPPGKELVFQNYDELLKFQTNVLLNFLSQITNILTECHTLLQSVQSLS